MVPKERKWNQVFDSLEDNVERQVPAERYSVKKELGRGGAKIVYRAVDNNSGREVAYVKPLDSSESKRELFMREARITAYLQHPNILPVYDVSDESSSFFICKLLRGKTLSDIRPRQLSQNDKISLFKKVCEALEYAHSRGVLHLDIKPDNIRLDKYGEVLVIDWGLAEIFCIEGIESPLDNPLISSQESSSQDYTSLGTPGYMSPEQIEGRKVEIRTDIFSLGALFYFMFHMKAPFKGKDINQIFDKTVAGEFEFRTESISPGLKSIISKCLSVNLKDRYNDISELIADLDAIENNYVPDAEKASFFRHIQMLYRRNRLISNLILLFVTVLVVLNTLYIEELNTSKIDAVAAKEKAEKYLLETLESQKKNEKLTKELSPRYYIQADKHWQFFQIPQAMKNCDIALKLDPQNQDAKLLKAKLLLVTAKYKEANALFKKLESVSNFKKLLTSVLKSNDPIKLILDKNSNSLKLRNSRLRIFLDQFRQTGNMNYLKHVILIENPKINKLNISFKNGNLDLSNNPGLSNINFLGGITFDSLNLSGSAVDNLEVISDKKIDVLDLSDSDVWELFSLEGVRVNKLILGKTKVPSLWALMKVNVYELSVIQDKNTKFPVNLLYRLKKLTMENPKTLVLPYVKKPSLQEIDISKTNLVNPKILMGYEKLKILRINKNSFPKDLANQLRKKGVQVY